MEAPPPDPRRMGAELPNPPKQPVPLLQISGYAPDTKRVLLILPSFRILQWEVIEPAK